ncbi:MAG: efflux transporter outer membrane subunit [Deltaproteobacteria bacterium]|nr:efflux transporter outer membrane subunit [Deltaproteobacteria bacterium]
MRKVLAAVLLLATLSCNFAPHYERPRLPVPNTFGGAGGSVCAADTGWRRMFGDARLQALIALALAHNRDLRVIALDVEVARAQFAAQRAQLLPAVGGVAQASISNVAGGGFVGNVTRTTGAAATSAPAAQKRRPEDAGSAAATGSAAGAGSGAVTDLLSKRTYTLGGSATYELDLFGRIRNLTAAARERYLRSVEAFRAAHLALVGQVVTQYLAERGFAEQHAIAVHTEETTRSTLQLTRRLFEAGQRSELDVRAIEAQWRAARGEIPRLQRSWAQAQNALVLLVGRPLPADLPPPRALDDQHVIADLAPGLPSQVLLRRPDVLEAEHALLAANANIGAARAAFFPDISLTGFGGWVSTSLSNLFGGIGIWSFSPQITQPIFTGGQNAANLRVTEVRKHIEIANYEKAIQTAFREVADALVARATYDTQITENRARVEAEQVRFNLSDARYREGVASYLDVLDAQQALYTAQQVMIQLQVARLTNLSDLYRALGGGWKEE